MKLSELSPALTKQFDDLFKQIDKHPQLTKQFEIDDENVTIQVKMERIRSQNLPPSGAAVCGGKFCKDIAVIRMSSKNDHVIAVLKNHFNNQNIPGFGLMPSRRQFDELYLDLDDLKV